MLRNYMTLLCVKYTQMVKVDFLDNLYGNLKN